MNSEEIKKIIEELLRKMNVSFDEIFYNEGTSSSPAYFLVKTPDSSALIGSKGTHLSALNHLVKRMVGKKYGDEASLFFIDVNNYQEKAIEELKAKVKIFSERAKSFGVDVELPPMSAYDRMLVHSYLSGDPVLKTESKGEGKDRHVVIKYIKE